MANFAVPPTTASFLRSLFQAKLVITFVYLLVGMGVVAMCYYLLKEDVTNRVTQTKERLKEKLLRLKVRLGWAPSAVLEQV